MTQTSPYQNLSGTSSTIGFFLYGFTEGNYAIIQKGWQAYGPSVPSGPNVFIGIVDSIDITFSTVTLEGTSIFLSGQFYYFSSPPCFKEDSLILCLQNDKEVYLPIQNLKKGNLVKTLKDGYVPIDNIIKAKFHNLESNDKRNRLYRCSKSNYPELFEDLIITGEHSILENKLTNEQREKTIELFEKVYITNGKSRLFAFLDERAVLYEEEGIFNIYHISLENNDDFCNYGIYANGLLVESCSKICIKTHS